MKLRQKSHFKKDFFEVADSEERDLGDIMTEAQKESFDIGVENILGIHNLKSYQSSSIGYVYFLCSESMVVYVGQTVDLVSRLRAHRSSKEFDDVKYIEVRQDEALEIEGAFIRALRPPLNGSVIGSIKENDKDILERFKAEHLLLPRDAWSLEEPKDYGMVLAIDGDQIGKIGYYDDDIDMDCLCVDDFDERFDHPKISDDEYQNLFEKIFECTCGESEMAVVYFDTWTDGYYLMPKTSLRSVPENDPRVIKWEKQK